jgi:hypothetical protein
MPGLHLVRIWVPDTGHARFADECRRQSLLVSQADQDDADLQDFMDTALADVDGWTE